MSYRNFLSVLVVSVILLVLSQGLRAQMHVDASGKVGVGTTSPATQLHIDEATANKAVRITLSNSGNGTSWEWVHRAHVDDALAINNPDLPGAEFRLTTTGTVLLKGGLVARDSVKAAYFVASGQMLTVPDYVFEKDYDLMPIEDLAEFVSTQKHLPEIAPATEINENGISLSEFQMQLLKKVEELTLYTLQQDQQIRELANELKTLQKTPYDSAN